MLDAIPELIKLSMIPRVKKAMSQVRADIQSNKLGGTKVDMYISLFMF